MFARPCACSKYLARRMQAGANGWCPFLGGWKISTNLRKSGRKSSPHPTCPSNSSLAPAKNSPQQIYELSVYTMLTEWRIKSSWESDHQRQRQNQYTILHFIKIYESYLIFAPEKNFIKDEKVYDFLLSRLNKEMSGDYFSHLSSLQSKLKDVLADSLNQMMIIPEVFK